MSTRADCGNSRGTAFHRCEQCIDDSPTEWITDMRDNRTLGQFVQELGEMVKLGECKSREFSRAINLAKWSPQMLSDSMDVSAACDMALSLIRANPKLGNYDEHP